MAGRSSEYFYPVAERFISINGEGSEAGRLAAFIRMRGCNLHCSFCDTSWACSDTCPIEELSVQDILSWLEGCRVKDVTLTGGEPLLTPHIDLLIAALGREGYRVEIETNGSVDIRPFQEIQPRPVFTLDYKCPGSGMEDHMLTSNYSLLNEDDCVKFVVGSRRDLDRSRQICCDYSLGDRCGIFLSAVFGKIDAKDIVQYMIDHHFTEARLQLQMHKYIWEPDQRGV